MKKIASLIALISSGFLLTAQLPQNSLHFDGVDDYVSAPLPAVFTNIGANDFTVEMWIKQETVGASRVFYAQLDASNFATILLNNGSVICYIKVSNVTYGTMIPMIPASQWTHMALTWDASIAMPRLYINGVLQAHTPAGASSSGVNNMFAIGSRTDGAQLFLGQIDEMRIWDVERTACEILSTMNSEPDGSEANLVAYYDFNRGTPGGNNTGFTILPDQVSGYNGTLNNFALTGTTSNWTTSGAGITSLGSQPSYRTFASDTICQGSSYTFGSQMLTTAGTYIEPFTSVGGCDSLVTLALALNPVYNTPLSVSACGRYVFDGDTLTASGMYYDTLAAVTGCDSILALDLTISNPVTSSIAASACGQFVFGGNVIAATGIYTDTLISAAGCDSIITLALTIHNSQTGSFTAAACESYLFNGNTLTASGAYSDTATTIYGCDSIITLNLTIHAPEMELISETACNSYIFNGSTLTESGMYLDTMSTVHGCDSIVILDLTINTVDVSVYQSEELLAANPSMASFQWLDCDNGFAPLAGETGFVLIPETNSSYAVLVTNNGCADTSACLEINTIGLPENGQETAVSVYPNPTTGLVYISVSEGKKITRIEIADINGRILQSWSPDAAGNVSIDLSGMPQGIYLAFIYNGGHRSVKRIIRQ